AEMLQPKIEAVGHIVADRGSGTAERSAKPIFTCLPPWLALPGMSGRQSRLQATFAFHACLLPARRVACAAFTTQDRVPAQCRRCGLIEVDRCSGQIGGRRVFQASASAWTRWQLFLRPIP